MRIRSAEGGSGHAAACGAMSPEALAREVGGDLDWIVMKALEKDRERRYDSPGALAEDLVRYFENRPVSARPPGTVYVLRQYAKRNKVAFSGAVGILLSLALGLAAALHLYGRERAARELADREAERGREVSRLLRDTLGAAKVSAAMGRDSAMVRDLLDATTARIEREPIRTPAVEAETDPVDHVEGVGLGATLQPFSLFREQRRRRLGLPRVSPISARTVFFPGKSASVFPEVDFGGSSSVPADAAAVWTRLDGPGVVDLRAASALGVEAAFSSPGIHTLRLTVGRHGSLEDDFAASATALVEIVPPGRDETLLPAAADAFVQRGDPDKNFNTGSLWMKYVGPTGTVNREIFMRFDLSSLAGRVIEGASLEFYATDVATSATAETRLVEDDSWSEDGITWNTRPAAGALLQSWALSDEGLLRVELDAAAIAGAAGDGFLSLRHSIASQSDNGPIFQFASRENADASRRPRLRVRHREDWPAYADWIAGFPSLPAGDRDPEDDPDGDGISNLEEYARRLSPHLAEKTRPSLVAEAGPDAPASLRFPGAAGMPPGVHPLVEHSASLEPALWSPVAGGAFEAAGPDLLWTPPAELREGRGGFFRLRLVRDR